MIHSRRGLIPWKKDCVGKQVAHTHASVYKHILMFLKVLCSVESELQNIVPSESVFNNGLLYVTRVPASRDILLLP